MKEALSLAVTFMVVALVSSQSFIPANHPNVYVSGRYRNTSSGIEYDWSAVTAQIRVSGVTKLQIDASGTANIDVWIEGNNFQTINLKGNGGRIDINGVNGAEKTIFFRKNTEAGSGKVLLKGFWINSGRLVPGSRYLNRKIEWIGDSLTCGYGNLGPKGCNGNGPDSKFEDASYSYATLVSNKLNADRSLVSWSGRGVVRNYGDKTPSAEPLPSIWPRTLGSESEQWNFNRWQPQAVVINLGTNDFSTPGFPTQRDFENGYNQFIRNIKSKYRNARIFIACPWMGNGGAQYVRNVANANGATFIDLQAAQLNDNDYGCDYHPNIQGHTKWANVAAPIISKTMGW